ncbi:MAG: major capsid protein, partial [Ilumatobacteraceae bacterium]
MTDRAKPDEPTRPEVPTDLADVEDEALSELLAKLTDEFDQHVDSGSRDVAALTALADDIDRIKGEAVAREDAAAQADAEVAALTERVRGAKEPEPTPEPEPTEPAPADPPPQPEPTEDEPEKVEDKVLVTAGARPPARTASTRPALGDVARRVPRPRVEPKQTQLTITAAADLPGLSPGTKLDLTQVAQAMHDRARNLSNDGRRAPVARISVPHTHVLGTDPMENVNIIEDLVGQPEAGALVASGGWCAPSVPIFELFDIGPDVDNIFDLPGLGTKVRSGVMIPSFYGIGDVTGALWTWTEQDDIDAATDGVTVKPCMKIPCPTFTECVMEAEGLCVTHGNLSDRAWPELTRQFLSIVMGAHQRRISAAKIAKVLADTSTVTPNASMLVSDAAGDLLNVIALAAADMRSQYRVSKRRSVDVLLPDWALEVLRSNMAMRQGVWDAMSITDAQITSWLTARGVRVQFTPDWQPLYSTAAATQWPANVTFAIWFTGSYVSIDGGEIDLGVVRDSTLNATNDFTAAWSEQFYQVCRRGPQGRQYTLALTPNGVTGCCPVV